MTRPLAWLALLFLVLLAASASAQEAEVEKTRRILEARPELLNALVVEGMGLLHYAAWHGQPDVATFLLSRGAHVDIRDKNRATPLHVASYRGYPRIAELLLRHGADVNAQDNDGTTPLKLARMQNHTAVIELLRSRGGRE